MIGFEIIKYSLRNIIHSKERTILTILSIFIGITTIFIFISFGLGLYNYIEDLSGSSSADKVLIQAKGSGAPGADDTFKLTDDDIKSILKTPDVYEATGVYYTTSQIKQDSQLAYSFTIGYDPEIPLMMDVFNIGTEKGRLLRPNEKNKAVLGYNYLLKNKIFKKSYDINDEIDVDGNKLKVIGFLEKVGNPQDDSQIYITNDFFKELYPDKESYAMIIAKVDKNNINQIVEKIKKNLRSERNQDEGEEDFFVQSFEEMIESYTQALNVVVGFVILIALISVLVSAVNTANTMITSVLERYKEIGVLKSIGARNSEVFKLFLFESSVLGLIAGIIGVTLGFILSYIGKVILANLGWSFLSPAYSIQLFVGCILFAVVTGAISGVIPAIRASKINPVKALRYE
jgi:putative ABC transport system permease protein